MKRFVEGNQINYLDERFYKSPKTGEYYPSMTQVLHNGSPTPDFLIDWWKNLGRNSDILLKQAGEEGTNVHNAIEALVQGQEINNEDELYNYTEWSCINKFVNFWTRLTASNKVIVNFTELQLVSDEFKLGGTLDMGLIVNGEKWYIDHKTSKSLNPNMFIQGVVYREMYNAMNDEKIERVFVLWLKSQHRKEKDTGTIPTQGEGWQLVEVPQESFGLYLNLYKSIRHLYDFHHGQDKPRFQQFPVSLKID